MALRNGGTAGKEQEEFFLMVYTVSQPNFEHAVPSLEAVFSFLEDNGTLISDPPLAFKYYRPPFKKIGGLCINTSIEKEQQWPSSVLYAISWEWT